MAGREWPRPKELRAEVYRFKDIAPASGDVSADGRAESDSGHHLEPAAGRVATITPEQLEQEIRAKLAVLCALNVRAQSRLTGVALADAERDMCRAETDALTCIHTLMLGARGADGGGLAHAVDDTDASEERESAQ